MRTVDWPTVFEGFKTFLDPLAEASWPIALGIVVFSFRRQIASLLNRIKQVTGFGGTAEFAPALLQADQQSEAPTSEVAPAADPTKLPPSDPVFDRFDQQLSRWLDEQRPGDQRLQLAWAIRSRSVSEAYRLHEFHYRVIYGSQIQALKSLNIVGRGKAKDFESFYNAAASNPLWSEFYKGRSFEMWGEFLTTAGYVQLIAGADPAEVEITAFGRQFLVWVTETGLPENRPG